jgi:uncharacterized protein (DUF952 family)/ribosomal protein S18 acetylase RimI-like enzyme
LRTIFHITTAEKWKNAKISGQLSADSLALEGFIHLSRPHQVLGVAKRIFSGQSGLVLLHVNQDLVSQPLKYEGKENNLYPHIYGLLNVDAVLEAFDFAESSDGFKMPKVFQMVGETCIRLGRPDDEAEIASVNIHAWQQSYLGIVPESLLAARPLSFYSHLSWWRSVVEGKTAATVFVAESAQNGIVGFCAVQPARDKEFKGYGEIAAIYCLNEFKNKGIGAALFRMGQTHLTGQGLRDLYLWVLKENPTSEFYERMGGRKANREKTLVLGKPLVEVVFEWKGS